MSIGTELVRGILDQLYGLVGIDACPGGWIITVTAAGAVFALIPVLGALLITFLRKWVGNRYSTPVVAAMVAIGVLSACVLPLIAFHATNSLLVGDSSSLMDGMRGRYCRLPSQDDYFQEHSTIGSVLRGGGGAGLIGGVTTAIAMVCALMSWPAVAWQARTALRRGPGWPARLFWLPFAAFMLGNLDLSTTVAGHLWLGFLPMALIGVAIVAMAGAPSWRVINEAASTDQRRTPPPDQRSQQPPRGHQPPPGRQPPSNHQPSPSHQPPNHPPASTHQPSNLQPAGYPPAPGHQPPPNQQHFPLNHQPSERVQPAPMSYAPMQRQASPPNGTRVAEPPRPPHKPTAVMPSLAASVPGESPPVVSEGLADTPGPLPFGPAATEKSGESTNWILDGDRFEPVGKLGSGGFGQVWLARDTRLDRHVAVKVAHAPDDETEHRMRREARALAAVRHPNCVRVYDIMYGSGGLAIVMEYIEGDTLADTVRVNGLIDDVAAARLWSTMAGALGAAHAKDVLHRDVKPTNVLVDPKGIAHLIDFGIARTKGDHTLTRAGLMVGTPDFLAQEVAAGGSATPASDSWQLAATVSYALTGKSPRGRRAEPGQALLAAAEGRPCVNIPQHSAHAALLTSALDNDPARRPSLATISRELDAWLAREGSSVDGPVTVRVPRQALAD